MSNKIEGKQLKANSGKVIRSARKSAQKTPHKFKSAWLACPKKEAVFKKWRRKAEEKVVTETSVSTKSKDLFNSQSWYCFQF